jgi:glycosyltransferase involved in cell wall biosynthesis
MKIAFVSSNEFAPWGGSEELWSQTAMRMAKKGFTVAANIKAWNPEAEKVHQLEQANCQVVRRSYDRKLSLYARALHKLRFRKIVYNVYDFLDQFRPEFVVISQGFNCDGLLWMEECSLRNIPFAVIVQAASDGHSWLDDPKVERLAKAYASAKKVFFVSNNNLETLIKQIGIDLPNSQIVANPFNVPYEIQIPWVNNQTSLKLACVARLDPIAKGQDILLDVLRDEKWKQRSLEVSFFGNGMNRQLLKKLANMWQIKQVKFCGYVDDIVNIWREHHAIILPSRYEGLPIALVEAMLCARPCIVTEEAAGNAKFVQDNVTGFIAQSPKAKFIDEALERAWQNRNKLREMGELASMSVRKIIPADPIEEFTKEIISLI